MLYAQKTVAALEAKRERFSTGERSAKEDSRTLRRALKALSSLSLCEIESCLSAWTFPGAWPTAEHEQYRTVTIAFNPKWSNHRQAREWALETLRGRATFAVDGSQILPARDISIPVAVAQVGWFENPHDAGVSYVKDVHVEVLTADTLVEDRMEMIGSPHWRVNWQRFKMEVERLVTYMQTHAHLGKWPLCFFDGSLLVSFAEQMRPEHQQLYTGAIVALLGVIFRVILVHELSPMLVHRFSPKLVHWFSPKLVHQFSPKGGQPFSPKVVHGGSCEAS